MYIPAYELKVNNKYIFNIKVFPLNKPKAIVDKNFSVNIIPNQLSCSIWGGDRVATITNDFELIGNMSYDQDDKDRVESVKTLTFEW